MTRPAGPPAPYVRELAARRWLARLVDWVLVLAVTSVLWLLAVTAVRRQATQSAIQLPGAGAVEVSRNGWSGIGSALFGLAGELMQTVALLVVCTLLVQVGVMALYDWAGHRIWGRTLGKVVTGLAVRAYDERTGQLGRITSRMALARTCVAVVVPGIGWILIIGAGLLLNPLLLLGVVLLLVSTTESASLRWSAAGRRCGHDRWTGTVVVHVGARAQLVAGREQIRRVAEAPGTRRAVGRLTATAQQGWESRHARQVRRHFRGRPR